jgi:hypothetical protein
MSDRRSSNGLRETIGKRASGAVAPLAEPMAARECGAIIRHCPRGCATTVASLATSARPVQNGDDGQSNRFLFATTARRKGIRLRIAPSRARNATGGPIVPMPTVHTFTRPLVTSQQTVVYGPALRLGAALLLRCLVVHFQVVVAAVPEGARVTCLHATLRRASKIERRRIRCSSNRLG